MGELICHCLSICFVVLNSIDMKEIGDDQNLAMTHQMDVTLRTLVLEVIEARRAIQKEVVPEINLSINVLLSELLQNA